MNWLARRSVTLGSLVIASASAALSAQGSDDGSDKLRPLLGEHRFVPNDVTRDPFSRTYVRNALGVGRALDIEFLPSLDIEGGDTIPGLSGDLLFAVLDFEFQHAVKDWMGVWGRVNLVGRLGTDVGALLSEGATILSGFEIGWLLRIVETNRVALSGTVNLWNNSFTGVNVADWVAGIINAEQVPLVQNVPSVQAGAGLRVAWGVSSLIGVTAATELGFGEAVFRREPDQVLLRGSGAVDLNLLARSSVPLGFVLGFEATNAPRSGDARTDRLSQGFFRIAYTGRDDFVIAVNYSRSRVYFTRQDDKDATSTGTILLNMRYYF